WLPITSKCGDRPQRRHNITSPVSNRFDVVTDGDLVPIGGTNLDASEGILEFSIEPDCRCLCCFTLRRRILQDCEWSSVQFERWVNQLKLCDRFHSANKGLAADRP